MAVAALLALLAMGGVGFGVLVSEPRRFTSHVGAAGGGLLLGMALFWLLPEIAGISGWSKAIALAAAVCMALILLDRFLVHDTDSGKASILKPLLAATAIHSLLDGWSVRAAPVDALSSVAVPLGLALHKLPEGLALGWIARRAFGSAGKAFLAAAAIESLTIVGAFAEARADQSGIAAFGASWIATVLAVIAGSFLFLGLHAVLPQRRNSTVMAVFFTMLAAVGGAAMLRH